MSLGEPRTSALNMTLPAFAAERRRLWRYRLIACTRRRRSAANQPHAAAAVDRWNRQTDGRTFDRYVDPAPYHRYAGSVSNSTVTVDFVINRFVIKSLSTSNMENITYCREQFNFELPSVILARHTSLFLDKLRHCDNCLIKKCYAYLTDLFCFDFVYLQSCCVCLISVCCFFSFMLC